MTKKDFVKSTIMQRLHEGRKETTRTIYRYLNGHYINGGMQWEKPKLVVSMSTISRAFADLHREKKIQIVNNRSCMTCHVYAA